jgi:hypothetical protein
LAAVTVIYSLLSIGFCVGYGINNKMPQHFVLAGGILGLDILLFFMWRWSQAPDVEDKFMLLVLGCLVVLLIFCTSAQLYVWTTPSEGICNRWADQNNYNLTKNVPLTTTMPTTTVPISTTTTTSSSTVPLNPCPDKSYGWTCGLYFMNANDWQSKNYSCCYQVCPTTSPILNLLTGTCSPVTAKRSFMEEVAQPQPEITLARVSKEDKLVISNNLREYASLLESSLQAESVRKMPILD